MVDNEQNDQTVQISENQLTEQNSSDNSQQKKAGIKSNFIYNLLGQAFTLLIPLVTTPYLSRILHEVGNGQISYTASIITYFVLFASLGFSTYGQREIARYQDDRDKKSQIFWEIFILRSICTVVALSVLYIWLFVGGFGEKYNLLILIQSIQVFAIIFDLQFFYYGEENFKTIAIRTIIIKVALLVCVFVFVKKEGDVWIYALCLSLSILVPNLFTWLGLRKCIKLVRFKELKLLRHIKPVLIIFLPTVITSVFTTLDKTMIGLLSGNPDYDNGCYEQAYKINSMAQTFIILLPSVMMSRNSYEYKNGKIEEMNRHIYMTCNYVWMTSLPFIAGFVVLASNFSSWFLGDGYVEVPELLQIMTIRLATSGFSIIFGNLFITIGKELYWTISVLMGAIINFVINFLMIPSYGAIGAAWATAITEFVIFVTMGAFVVYKKLLSPIKILISSWKYLVATGFMFGVIFLMQYFINYSWWEFLLIGLCGIVVYGSVLLVLKEKILYLFLNKLINKIKKSH